MNSTMWQRYCDDSTIHGFKELFYSISNVSKIFWILIIVLSSLVTCIQIYIVIDNFSGTPTKTQISVLSSTDPIMYPPLLFCMDHFVDWVDLDKVNDWVHRYGLKYETFLYAMSYANRVYTRRLVDVASAETQLKEIMKKENFSSFYDLLIALALSEPSNMKYEGRLYPFFNEYLKFCYIGDLQESLKNASRLLTFKVIRMTGFINFESTKFNTKLKNIFGYSFAEEYVIRRLYKFHEIEHNKLHDTEYYDNDIPTIYKSSNNYNLSTSGIVEFYPSGNYYGAYATINILSNNYEFYLKGSLYKWMSSKERPCLSRQEFVFGINCLYRCATQYKIMNYYLCRLYILLDDFSPEMDLSEYGNLCTTQAALLNGTGSDNAIEAFDKCMLDCRSSCTQWLYEYHHQILSPNQPTHNDSDLFIGDIYLSYLGMDNIMFIALVPSMTWDEAFANIGGLLGLWMGGSLMSFVQALYYCCWLPAESRMANRRNRIKQKNVLKIEVINVAQQTEEMHSMDFSLQTKQHMSNVTDLNKKINILNMEMKQIKAALHLN